MAFSESLPKATVNQLEIKSTDFALQAPSIPKYNTLLAINKCSAALSSPVNNLQNSAFNKAVRIVTRLWLFLALKKIHSLGDGRGGPIKGFPVARVLIPNLLFELAASRQADTLVGRIVS